MLSIAPNKQQQPAGSSQPAAASRPADYPRPAPTTDERAAIAMLLETRSGDVHVQQASTVRRRMSALGRALCTSCDTTTAPVAAVLLAAPAAAEIGAHN